MTRHLRRLTPTDANALWHLRLEALEHDSEAFGHTAEEHRHTAPDPSDSRLIEHSHLSPEAHTFVLGAFAPTLHSAEHQLVATATFARQPGIKEHHKGHLRGVYVTPAHRGQGLAHRLLSTLIDTVRPDPTLEQLLLGVAVSNGAALRLYRSLGFTVYGTEPHALKVNGAYVDEHLMILPLRTS